MRLTNSDIVILKTRNCFTMQGPTRAVQSELTNLKSIQQSIAKTKSQLERITSELTEQNILADEFQIIRKSYGPSGTISKSTSGLERDLSDERIYKLVGPVLTEISFDDANSATLRRIKILIDEQSRLQELLKDSSNKYDLTIDKLSKSL
ncbi:hypothetical protein GJ496_007511 [Pomphorhynchus laevis]|nr:hypothetical protein GJ496_007511 [Pomphorhynchus laevis]